MTPRPCPQDNVICCGCNQQTALFCRRGFYVTDEDPDEKFRCPCACHADAAGQP